MRITNKMMTNNMMNNINKNKINMTKLEQQYSTGKKIQRPSEDPIITVRALKLRTNLAEIKQYHEKNIPDAKSWMDVSESALKTVNSLLSKINTYCVQGSTDTLTATDRASIAQNLEELQKQIYQEGNTNYAGRYVFTGYKTDSSLLFTEPVNNLEYTITESFESKQIQILNRVVGSYSIEDYDDSTVTFDEAPNLVNNYRIQLSYDNLSNTPISQIRYTKSSGWEAPVDQTPFTNIVTVSSKDKNAYTPEANQAHFIPDTGELILGKDLYEELRTASDIQVTYEKNEFAFGDLKPEHYFSCDMVYMDKPELEPVKFIKTKQPIQYEINYNQKLTVNTEGSDAITHSIGRDISDIIKGVDDVTQTEAKIAEVELRLKDDNLTPDEKQRYERMLEQLDTELELKKEIMQKAFEKGMSGSSKEQNRVNVAVADLGSRYVRLNLTDNRLSSQKVDFEDLLSTNEEVDLVETVIKYSSAEVIYNASLSAASKVVQNTLLDFL